MNFSPPEGGRPIDPAARRSGADQRGMKVQKKVFMPSLEICKKILTKFSMF